MSCCPLLPSRNPVGVHSVHALCSVGVHSVHALCSVGMHAARQPCVLLCRCAWDGLRCD